MEGPNEIMKDALNLPPAEKAGFFVLQPNK